MQEVNNTQIDALCYCGSGKLHRYCCFNKVIKFPRKSQFEGNSFHTVQELLAMATEALKEQEFHSLEEINTELARFYNNQNNLPKAPFLGLTPAQMHRILYTPFDLNNEIFHFDYVNHQAELINTPLINSAIYFLNYLKEAKYLRATAKGNLPMVFVKSFYQDLISKDPELSLIYSKSFQRRFPCRKEGDLYQLKCLKHLLLMQGIIKKRAGKFSLTKKGEKIIETNNTLKLFENLVEALFNKFNWGFQDLYPSFSLIQSSAVFNVYLLHKHANNWISKSELGEIYLRAFPKLIEEAPYSYLTPEDDVINSFSFRFLEIVSYPLGWVKVDPMEEGMHHYNFKVSAFFKKCFKPLQDLNSPSLDT